MQHSKAGNQHPVTAHPRNPPSLRPCRAPGATPRNVAWSCQIDHPSHPARVMTLSRIVHGPPSVRQRIQPEETLWNHYFHCVRPTGAVSPGTLAPGSYAPHRDQYETGKYLHVTVRDEPT